MKVNKRGWSLVVELVAILIAVILLVYVVYGLNKLGLVRNMNEALPGIKPDLIISGKTTSYQNVESDLIDASKKYVEVKYNGEFTGNEIVIRVSHLVKNGYMSTIRDTNGKECSGYIMVIKSDGTIGYNPYLKCSKYASDGYESEYDW